MNTHGRSRVFQFIRMVITLSITALTTCGTSDFTDSPNETGGSPFTVHAITTSEKPSGIPPGSMDEPSENPSCKRLVAACESGDLEEAQKAIDSCPDIDFDVGFGQTPLMISVIHARPRIAELLMDKDPNIDQQDHNGKTALILATEQGNLDMVKRLVERGANPDDPFMGMNERYTLTPGVVPGISFSPLAIAAENNRLEIAEYLLSKGASGGRFNEDTPLGLAVFNGHDQMVKLLLSKGANANGSFIDYTHLMHACRLGFVEIAEMLLRHGAKTDPQAGLMAKTPLMFAAESGHPEMVDLLLRHRVPVDQANKMRQTALFCAADAEMVNHLIRLGLAVNHRDAMGATPLFHAAFQGNTETAQALLAQGADLEARIVMGHTPLRATTDTGHLDTAKFLISSGADIHAKDHDGDFALIYAMDPKMVQLLIDSGARVNDRNNRGQTPLMMAAARRLIDSVRILIENGAEISDRDPNGHTALMMAMGHSTHQLEYDVIGPTSSYDDRIATAAYLISKGADVNAKDDAGQTALFYVVTERDYELVECLIENGADVGIKNNQGQTALSLAEDLDRKSLQSSPWLRNEDGLQSYTRMSAIQDLLRTAALEQEIAADAEGDPSEKNQAEKLQAERIRYFKTKKRNSLMFPTGTPSTAPFSDSKKRVVIHDTVKVVLDLSTQVLGFEVPEDREFGDAFARKEADILPSIAAISQFNDFAPSAVLVQKAKQFDDGLYASVEMLAQSGTEGFSGKRALLEAVLARLKQVWRPETEKAGLLAEPMGRLTAAMDLAGQQPEVPAAVRQAADNIRAEFLADEKASKPIGFYTWTPELARIFQQDRLLQTNLMPAEAQYDPKLFRESAEKIRLLSTAVTDSSESEAYRRYLNFIQKLTNPFPPEFRDLATPGKIENNLKYCFFPPSRGHETELVKKLYGNRSIPEGFSLIDTLIERIREGGISLAPTADSGWYDYQVHALEPLVIPERMPEAPHVFMTDPYKKELEDLFKAAIALTRETHVKQVEMPWAGAAMPPIRVDIFPAVSLEPTAEFFLRRGKSYTFIKQVLAEMFTEETLQAARRAMPSGPRDLPLLEELASMESLFYGAYGIIGRQLGMTPRKIDGRNAGEDMNRAWQWICAFQQDPDVGADSRMMVPLFYDIERRQIKVWVFLGYTVKPLEIWFYKSPAAVITDLSGAPVNAELEFHAIERPLITPVSAEIYVNRLLDRDEFRRFCDRYRNQSEILMMLKALR